MTVKIRKVGSSNVLTVPKGIKVTSKEFDVYEGREGAITFLPVTDNPFNTTKTLEKYGKYDDDDTGFIDAGVEKDEI
ncbi:hypothetical protein GCM10022297_14810 [Lactobacillus hamsteri]|uniref:AbrB family transcriptional regulator n=1 Tax=Lactobacillus hamsteri DSM 5661 = JCM 6256 TaxID=1423754 RepID=A0A0R1YCT5_9LACO|nr:hypothetical protein [Lactobacillus hamsteri]KRM40111.1 hypothetical protein FC39_GL000846 [Lactobacillus hamsteri DSM 5661 = JCM 6256]